MTYPNRNTARTNGSRRRRSRLPVIRILSITMILAGLGFFGIELYGFSQRETLLAEDVTVGGVEVGGLTVNAAVTKWEQVFNQPLVLLYGDAPPIVLDPASIDWRLNSNTMRANAQASAGDFWPRFLAHLTGSQLERSGATVSLLADYQEGLLRTVLEDIARRYDRAAGSAGYDVATLTVFEGTPGTQLDIDESIDRIDAALRDPVNRVVTLPIGDSAASRPSLSLLQSLIIAYLDTQGFIYDSSSSVASIFILDLQTGEELNILGDVAFSAASTMKVPILVDFYRSLDIPPSQDEAFIMANSLLCSRNSSSNLLLRLIGQNDILAGVRSVSSTAQFIGARNTYINAPFVEGVAGEALGSTTAPATAPNPDFNTDPDPFNQTTAEDLGTTFALIYDCANYGSGLQTAYPGGEFSQNECRQMLELMSGNDLLRLLQGGIPAGTRISHKNGWLTETVGDAGIVYPPSGRNYVISVFLWEDTGFQNFERLWPLVEGISRAAYNYFDPGTPLLTPRTDLPATAQDCEGNYLPPSPELTNLDDIDSWRMRP
ncbi:MAG: serine hydrolase [Anaerolineae bacterium]|nr:serine hydrolase [Anaerolineae bacterium]